jgi:hypothetical protein
MPQIRDLDIPDAFYLVIREPAPLAGMRRPSSTTPWKDLYHIGLRQVVCLTEDPPNYLAEPLIITGHFPLKDLYDGITPAEPESERERVRQAASLILSLINRHIEVAVHCAGGTGRTGTVIGCVLRGLGYNTSEVLSYLYQLNRKRGARNGWPESQWQTDMIRIFTEFPACLFGE